MNDSNQESDVEKHRHRIDVDTAATSKLNKTDKSTNNIGNSTQLIERSIKEIEIREESHIKQIFKTREIIHHPPPPPPPPPNQVDTNSALQQPTQQQNIGTNVLSTLDESTNSFPRTSTNELQHPQDQNGFSLSNDEDTRIKISHQQQQSQQLQATNDLSKQYETYNSIQINDDNNTYGTRVNINNIVDPSSNYQNLSVRMMPSSNGVIHLLQPNTTYDTAYGTTGLVVQVPANSLNQGIYGTAQVDPIYAMSNNNPQMPIAGLASQTTNGLVESLQWRDPEISEVITFLNSPDPTMRANAVAYLQHLSFMDDNIKKQARLLGGIPILVDLLNRDIVEVQRNVCGALRNLSYGKKNDENKRAIKDSNGVQALICSLVNNPDDIIRELATGVLWNLSSCEDVKLTIIDEALSAIVSVIIVPYTSWFRVNMSNDCQYVPNAGETHWSTVFRNSTGVLRNISSAGPYARKQLRDCEGLVESILYILRSLITKNDVENKLVENCVCLLRNLSYKCQEIQDPDYDKNITSMDLTSSTTNSFTNSIKSSSTNLSSSLKPIKSLGCFRLSRKSKSKSSLSASNASEPSSTLLPPHHASHSQTNDRVDSSGLVRTSTQLNVASVMLPRSNISEIPKVAPTGKELLWQPDVVKPYLALLSGCSNYETLEAAAGAIQNLAACYWQPSIDIRASVRKEKGLPVLVELLRIDVDPVVCVVATALRNLAIDQRNKELIGKYAMPDLVNKLPSGQGDHENACSDDTIAAVLATLHEVISNNADFARSLYEANGLNRLTYVNKNKSKFSVRVQKFTAQVLLDMWKFTELREIYKKGGWKESQFVVKSSQISSKTSTYSVNSNTIDRPCASQHTERSSSLRQQQPTQISTMNTATTRFPSPNTIDMVRNTVQPNQGTVPMTTLNGHFTSQVNNVSALYAQVDRQRKRNGHPS